MKGIKLEKIYPYTYEADSVRLVADRFSYEGTYLLLSLIAPTIWIRTSPCTSLGFPPETIDRISVRKRGRWFDIPIIDIRIRGKRSLQPCQGVAPGGTGSSSESRSSPASILYG